MSKPAADLTTNPGASPKRFGPVIERRDGADFPYYNGRPTLISGQGWLIVVAAVIVGFTALVTLPFAGPISGFIPAILFAGLPLVALAYVSHGHWKALFRKPSGRDVGLMVLFALLNVVITFGVGSIVSILFGAKANPEAGMLAEASPFALAMFYPRTAIQLLGEELLTILPFLALLYLFVHKLSWSRTRAVALAWVATAVAFGLVHLPTYDWNILQCILIIGTARIVLTLAYIRTKNLWVSAGAHILNDWILFTGPLIFAAAA